MLPRCQRKVADFKNIQVSSVKRVKSTSVWMIPSSSDQVWFASKHRHRKNAVVVLQMDWGSTCMCCCWPGTAPIGALASIGIQRLRYLSPCPPRPTHTIPLVQHPNCRKPNLQHLTPISSQPRPSSRNLIFRKTFTMADFLQTSTWRVWEVSWPGILYVGSGLLSWRTFLLHSSMGRRCDLSLGRP